MRAETLSSLQVPTFNIGVMADVLEMSGVDPSPAFERVGLDPVAPLSPTGFVSARIELEFELEFLQRTPDRYDLWVEVGRRHKLYAYGTFGLALGTSPTLRDYVRLSARARDLFFTFLDYRPVEREAALCGIELCLDAVPEALGEMSLFRDLGAMSSVVAEICPDPGNVLHIELARAEPLAARLAELIGMRVAADCPRTALVWPASLTDMRLPNGSNHLHRYYTAQCEIALSRVTGNDLQAAITRVIMLQPSANGTIDAVAHRLNMSVRTLQRRLQDHGLNFRAILVQAYSQVATALLANPMLSIAQVAAQLGYADRASFDLAFSRWTGVSPRRYRDSLIGSGTKARALTSGAAS